MRLVLINENGAHMVEYFHKNHVYPAAVVFDPLKFKLMGPYLSKEDEILIVIKGLTSFKLSEVYQLFKDLNEYKDKVGKITIMSNVHLGIVPYVYYLYEGDLFYGAIKKVENGKIRELTTEEQGIEVEDDAKKGKKAKVVDKSEIPPELLRNNSVMAGFKKYNYKKIKLMIYGKKDSVEDSAVTKSSANLFDKLVAVDLFK